MSIDPVAASIIVALIINLPAWWALKSASQKARAETQSEQTKRDRLEDEITERVLKRADDEIKRFEERFNSLLRGAWQLHGQVLELRGTPVYTPPQKYETGPLGNLKEGRSG